ncbi:MAG: DNA translocase FtsK 4TM domain-containing protein, partial [Anaerolineae bacterium]
MANGKQGKRKTRKSNSPSRGLQLTAAQEEALVAAVLIAIAVLTAMGAFNLSRGNILDGWTDVLGTLFGWGRYLAPLFFGGLGVWLLLDSLDLRPDIGGARPLGLAILFVVFLTVLHLTPEGARGPQALSSGEGGGIIGYFISDLMVGAIGILGAYLILLIAVFIGLVLLFQISPKRLFTLTLGGFRWLESAWIDTFNSLSRRAPRRQKQPPTSGADKPSARERPARATGRRNESSDPAAPGAPTLSVSPRPAVAAHIVGGGEAQAPIHREWRLPRIEDILVDTVENEPSATEIREKVKRIEETLKHFGVPARVIEVSVGPTITQFGVEPGFLKQKSPDGSIRETKVKVSRISALQHDLELALASAPVRVEAPVPGKSIVGIEVPNTEKSNVSLRGVMESDAFKKMGKKSSLTIALGQDVSGQAIVADLGAMPHLLIAGATGSGKSVCINALIAGLLLTNTPDDVQFVMVDPKRVELSTFRGVPHLLTDVVVEMDLAVAVLQRAVAEMDHRFKMFAKVGVRNLDAYNQLAPEKRREAGLPEAKLPFLVLIVDELADLMMVAADEVERAITRLAQMARATGIHLVLATQRPSVDVVTGLIKANFPSRISFAVTSQIDSRVVLDTPGAEKLLGRGDMLYMASDSSKLARLQGGYVSDQELEKLVTYWKGFVESPPPSTVSGLIDEPRPDAPLSPASRTPLIAPIPIDADKWVQGGFKWNLEANPAESDEDRLLKQAIQIIQESDRASISLLQRKLRIGYSRAARLMDLLQEKGYVGPEEAGAIAKGRQLLTPARTDPTAPPAVERTFVEENDDEDPPSRPPAARRPANGKQTPGPLSPAPEGQSEEYEIDWTPGENK